MKGQDSAETELSVQGRKLIDKVSQNCGSCMLGALKTLWKMLVIRDNHLVF